jgi:uncharacterized protein
MYLADRVYSVITDPANIYSSIAKLIPNQSEYKYKYWRRVLRMAALCHDVGHLPFSHAGEKDLLPEGWDHERLTVEIICSDKMQEFWSELKIDSEDVAKLAVGPKEYKRGVLSTWEALLAEIIVGDAFGVDRMDYLLRDSHHTGVAYGKFDHHRLIDTLRILPKERDGEKGSEEPTLGIEEGGFHSAEALLIARYFMFKQLYLHHVRRIYDIHLMDFILRWRNGEKFSINLDQHLGMTDNEILTELQKAYLDKDHLGHDPARRIVQRGHYKRIYQSDRPDKTINPDAATCIYEAAVERYGKEFVRLARYPAKGNPSRLFNVPLEHEFILYKYGPYSFNLTDELVAMRSDLLLRNELCPPYGPSIIPGQGWPSIKERFPKTLQMYRDKIAFIADKLGDKSASELERLATALYVTLELEVDREKRGEKICELKPHVSKEEAEAAIRFVDEIIEESREIAA